MKEFIAERIIFSFPRKLPANICAFVSLVGMSVLILIVGEELMNDKNALDIIIQKRKTNVLKFILRSSFTCLTRR